MPRNIKQCPRNTKSVKPNIPLLIAKNSPALFGFEARIVIIVPLIIVPLYMVRSFEITFHFSPFADLLNTNNSPFSIECACWAVSEADTITFWESNEYTVSPSRYLCSVRLIQDSL